MDGSVVLDTSVVIKWFRQGEVLADQSLALRKAYLDGQIEITVPSLLAYELTNVLRYKGDLTTGQVQDAVQSLFDMRFVLVVAVFITCLVTANITAVKLVGVFGLRNASRPDRFCTDVFRAK